MAHLALTTPDVRAGKTVYIHQAVDFKLLAMFSENEASTKEKLVESKKEREPAEHVFGL